MRPTAAMDDEAQKRNTDCVYFLASPLTCKKGNNCEFRHSEEARMNPRDCFYWLYKTCLNANCNFRHPPLDTKPTPPASSTQQLPAPSATSSVASALGASTSIRTITPCFFFSQGYCSKAEKCPFLHGTPPQQLIDAGLQQMASTKTSHGNEAFQNNKIAAAPKWNGSTPQQPEKKPESKPTSGTEPQFVPSKALIPTEEVPQKPADSRIKLLPSRHEKEWNRPNKLTKPESAENVPSTLQLHGSKQGSSMAKLQQKPLPEIEKAQPIHPGGGGRNNSVLRTGETWRKNASLQLESNGSDQREDGEYSPMPDAKERVKSRDKSLSFKRVPETRIDNVSVHRHQRPHALQRMDHGSASSEQPRDHNIISGNVRTIDIPKRSLDEYSDAGDLRAHLSKRRRNATGEQVEAKSSGKRESYPQVRRSHQDLQGKEIVRLPSRNVGMKRPLQTAGSSPESGTRISPAITSLKSSPTRQLVADHPRKEPKIKDKDLSVYGEVAPLSDARAHLQSKTKKPHSNQEISDFSGPKSLAQIKAERMAKSEAATKTHEGNGLRIKSIATHIRHVDANPRISAKSFGSTASTSKVEKMQTESTVTYQKGSKPEHKTAEFEGPKPLSLLLKGKRKLQSNDDTKENTEEKSKEIAEITKEIEDGEVGNEEEKSKALEVADVHNTNPTSHTEDPSSRSSSDAEDEGTYESEQEPLEDIESSDDRLKLELESGENVFGDDDYVLDDDDEDEDDFAKKLGGFFSS